MRLLVEQDSAVDSEGRLAAVGTTVFEAIARLDRISSVCIEMNGKGVILAKRRKNK